MLSILDKQVSVFSLETVMLLLEVSLEVSAESSSSLLTHSNEELWAEEFCEDITVSSLQPESVKSITEQSNKDNFLVIFLPPN